MSKEKRFGLIGYPLGHSLSKPIHESLFRENLSNVVLRGAEYGMFEINPDKLEEHMEFLKTLNGFNCTIPFKQTIMKHLDEIDERAQFYGAVNTVKQVGGKLFGYNTDWIGFCEALKCLADPKDGKILLLGAGGVSRMMAFECGKAGARQIDILTRTPEKGNELAKEISQSTGTAMRVVSLEDLNVSTERGEYYDLILNGSPSGMWPKTEGLPLSSEVIRNARAVYDTVYNPTLTRLLLEAKLGGVPAKGGISMLVGQAAAAQKIWLDVDFKDSALELIAEKMKTRLNKNYRMNIVLCGFMGSGKSFVGEKLARKIGYDFVDLDKFIEVKTHKSIPRIFKEKGEAEFRRLEVEGLKEIAGLTGVVLALGGGTIILDTAYEILKKLPVRIVFLEVSEGKMFERVQSGEGRPLLDKQDFEENARQIYKKRLPRYHEVSHLTVDGDVDSAELVNQLIKILGFKEGKK